MAHKFWSQEHEKAGHALCIVRKQREVYTGDELTFLLSIHSGNPETSVGVSHSYGWSSCLIEMHSINSPSDIPKGLSPQ